ncbi:MFS transporter [Gordonibacter massiliensis (ex Traore et al. 2017)]|uniref:MFS transporter n=1 Tax=Gordonibacter massiliensis (ex Traore et al. 2017) TaxID=1841863 RepID=A0A842JB82_9ACTN|nr:MFS transporter [Gordonibacter massiliensis (ex Traore et al. 2017)]MBC2889412.1 MFS transporter [Gordonibacter massiliensis (ex Traore et al. 2017)]
MAQTGIAAFGVQNRQLTQTERWICFSALFFFGFTAAFNLFKAAPAIAFIGADLGFDEAGLGYIMSSYAIAALVLAYPGMLIMQKIGVKASVLISCVLMLIGSVIGSFAPNAALFLVGRAIEGCAYGLICVIGPNIMPRLFPLKNQGLVMGIWSLWIPVGTIIAFFLAPVIFESAGWRPIWYVSLIMEVVSLVWMFVSVKMPQVPENELVDGDVTRRKKPGKCFMFAAIMMSVAFLAWVYVYVDNINTLYPTFLQQTKGMSVFDSSMLPNWIAIITIPVGILFGVLSDKWNARKYFVAVPYLVVALLMFFCAFTPGEDLVGPWTFCILMGVCAAGIPMGTRAIIPVLVPNPKKTDLALATMAFATGLAQCMGSLASLSIAEIGWTANGQFVLAPLALIASLIVFICVKSDRKVLAIRKQEEAEQAAE